MSFGRTLMRTEEKNRECPGLVWFFISVTRILVIDSLFKRVLFTSFVCVTKHYNFVIVEHSQIKMSATESGDVKREK